VGREKSFRQHCRIDLRVTCDGRRRRRGQRERKYQALEDIHVINLPP